MFIVGSLVDIAALRLLPFRICSGLCVCGGAQKPAGSTGMLFSGPWYVSFSLISDGAPPARLLLSHLCLCLRYFWCAELGRYLCIVLPCMLAMLLHWSPNSQVLGHCRIPLGTEAGIVCAGTRDAATTTIIILAGEQVMLKHSMCTDNGQHSELRKVITDTGWWLKDGSLKLSGLIVPFLFYPSSFCIWNVQGGFK